MSLGPLDPHTVQLLRQASSQGFQQGFQQGVDAAVRDLLSPEVALPRLFLKLAHSPYRIRSHGHATGKYSCIAWAVGRTDCWFWPGHPGMAFWPSGITAAVTLQAFIELFQSLGYECCSDRTPDWRFERVAIHIRNHEVQHAARQLLSGRWSSKAGPWWLIEHEFEALAGHTAEEYGDIAQLMRRRRTPWAILSELIRG